MSYTGQHFGRELPRVSRRLAEAMTALAAHVGSLPRLVDAVNALCGGGFSARAGPISEPSGKPVVWARADDGRGVAVAADGVLAGALAAAVLGQSPPDEAAAPRDPTPVERGILCFLVAALVEGRGLTVAVSDLAPPEGSLMLALRCVLGGAAGLVQVWVPADFARAPSALIGPPDRLAPVPVTLVLARGHAHVTTAEVATLQPRDVVVLIDAPALRLGHGGFPCRLEGDALRVHSAYERGHAMNETLARDLPVELVCELGRVTLSAKEVLELAPGAVVIVPEKVGATVVLTAGGRVIARGELIDVDGQVGVRIGAMT